jgi:cytochrome c peroxidase
MNRKQLSAAVLMLSLAGNVAAGPIIGPPPPPPPPPPLTPLPPPPQPAGNLVTAAKANLGKTLFWDEQLSSTRTVACGSCHQAAAGGADHRSQLGSAHTTHPGPDGVLSTADDVTSSPGVVLNAADGSFQWSAVFGLDPQVTPRTAMSAINSAYAPEVFWDGRAAGTFKDPETGATLLAAGGALENQVLGPPTSTVEMSHIGRSWADVAARIASSVPLALATSMPVALADWIGGRGYGDLFSEAFGDAQVTGARIAMAIASYERTLVSDQTPLDAFITGAQTLTPDESAGLQLFRALPCAGCHDGALTSDNQFHFDGVRPADEDSGRVVVTHNLADLGAMKTPSLRNAALRPVFMHDGRFTSLAEVVDFYDRGGDFNPPGSPAARPLNLTPLQKAQLVAFLGRPLTDPRVAAGTAPFDKPGLFSESAFVPEVLTGGVPGGSGGAPQPVAMEPALTGNPQFTLGVTGALGGAAAVLVVDASEPPATGGIPASGSFARLATTLQGDGADGGYGSVTLAIPSDASLQGRQLYARWYVADAGAADGVASSPAVRITVFGPHGTGAVTGVAANGASPARAMHLYASQPNPFPVSTTVRFDLYQAGDVHLAVFDVGGRRVRTLFERTGAPAGAYALPWDGRDDAGHAVAGGVYFYRLEAGHDAQTTRVIRVH